jgi:hypothetical protein
MGFSRKLMIAFGACMLVAAALAVAALRLVDSLSTGLETAVNSGAKGIEIAGTIQADVQEMLAQARGTQVVFAIRKLENGKDADCSACHNPEATQGSRSVLARSRESVERNVRTFRSLAARANRLARDG